MTPEPAAERRRAAVFGTGCFLVAINFAWFSSRAAQTYFAPDEMMNMAWAWEAGFAKIAVGLFDFWSGVYRPAGALYYWTLYHLFGLNALPFRVFDLAVLAFNLILAYRFARILGGSRLAGWLSTFLLSYHEKISICTTYDGAFVYDRLCFTFYFAAFVLYLEARNQNRSPGIRRGVGIIVLYVLALDSKEMAASLPVLMLVYELLWHKRNLREARAWAVILAAGIVTVAFIASRTAGPNALALNPAYRPSEVTIGHFLHSQSDYMNELLFQSRNHQPRPPALLIFCGVFALAALLRDRCLTYSGLHILITTLPIAFIHDRGGGCLYIVYAGWTLFAARVVHIAAQKTPLHVPWCWIPVGAAAAFGLLAFTKENVIHQARDEGPFLSRNGATRSIVWEVSRFRARIRPHSTVVYLHSRFKDWDMVFITELVCDDHTLRILLADKTPVAPEELASASLVLDFDRNGRLTEPRRYSTVRADNHRNELSAATSSGSDST